MGLYPCQPLSFDAILKPEGVVAAIGSLFGALAERRDRRDAPGLRHGLERDRGLGLPGSTRMPDFGSRVVSSRGEWI